jgi:hypothetical protein
MRNYSGLRAAIFTSPLSPAFDPFLYQALLFSISSPCLYYFRLYGALRFRARTRRSAKGPAVQTGTADCRALLGHSHSLGEVTAPSQRQRAMALGSQTFNYRDRFWLAVTGPVSSSWWAVWGSRSGGDPPNPPPRPASGSHRFPNTLGQVGEQYGPSIAPFARARCPFSPLVRPYSPGGAARGSHTGQFSCFGPRSCFIA